MTSNLDEYLTGLALTEWRQSSSSVMSLMNGQFGTQSEPLHDTLLKMKNNKDWHPRPCCTVNQHLPSPVTGAMVQFDRDIAELLQVPVGTMQVTAEMLMKMALASLERPVGGAFYTPTARKNWIRLFPNTLAAHWATIGGAEWRYRPIPQQMKMPDLIQDPAKVEILHKNVLELFHMGVYETVPESEEEEQRDRERHQEREALYLVTKPAHIPGNGTTSEDTDSDSPVFTPFIQADQPQKNNPAVMRATMAATIDPRGRTAESECTNAARCRPNNSSNKSGSSPRWPGTQAPPTHTTDCPNRPRRRNETSPQTMYSRLFTQPKPEAGAGDRLLTDLKTSGVNRSSRKIHFKADNVGTFEGLIKPGDFFWKIDLRKAYHQVLILEKLRKFLRSQWIDLTPPRTIRRIQQRTLAQGFGPAGLILGKQLKPLLQMLRAMGIRVCLATDDLIGAVSTTEQGFKEMFITVRLLVTELGGILSPEKCIFNLPQTICTTVA